jgi:hypothetical protein
LDTTAATPYSTIDLAMSANCSPESQRNGAMRRLAVLARSSFQIGLIFLGLFSVVTGADPASAFSFDQTIERCRQTVGRPIVRACMSAKSDAVTGVDFDACRAKASPRVRACVRRAMIVAFGHAKVEQTIEHCRQTLGRPLVKACMRGGHARANGATRVANLEACRAKASPQVRACVRRTINVAR